MIHRIRPTTTQSRERIENVQGFFCFEVLSFSLALRQPGLECTEQIMEFEHFVEPWSDHIVKSFELVEVFVDLHFSTITNLLRPGR